MPPKPIPIAAACVILLFMAFPELSAALSVTDMSGRTVEVPENPERIVCLGPGTLRLIVYLQAQDKVVGVERMEKKFSNGRPYWLAHPELHELPVCGPGGPASINQKPNMELLIKLGPEVIFITYMKPGLAREVQATLDIPVVVLSYGTFANFDETVFKALKTAGKVLHRGNRADVVIRYIQSTRMDLRKRTKGAPENTKPQAYIGGIGYRGAHGIESTKQAYAPFDWVRAKNAAKELDVKDKSHLFISKEVLLSMDPDIIFIDGGGLPLVIQAYQDKPSIYNGLNAFKKKRVFLLHPFNWYTTNIGTVMVDAYAVGKILYSDRFQDINLAEKADAIYNFLVGEPVYLKMKDYYGPVGSRVSFIEEE